MTAKEAVAKRIEELCLEKKITVNTLANEAGMPKICDGLSISLRSFFDSPLFEGLEQEIR